MISCHSHTKLKEESISVIIFHNKIWLSTVIIMNEESFWPRFFSFFPNKKFIDLGMDRIMLLCMPCSFLWRKITFHHRFNQFPINALLKAIKTEFSGLDDLVKNQFRGRVGLTMQI